MAEAEVEALDRIEREITAGERFAFGENWRRLLSALNEERIALAERSLKEMLRLETLRGARFLDVGSGSGLFSLAARRLGARVHSFDCDPSCIACTEELKRRFFPNDPEWTISRGSILDRSFVQSLGVFDVVYAWGVLHHTGALDQALDNTARMVADEGRLFLAIYNDQGIKSVLWRRVKRLYCSSALGRLVVSAIFIPYFVLGAVVSDLAKKKNPFARYRASGTGRGMSRVRDWFDWLGGLPFEVAKPEVVFDVFHNLGFRLERLVTCGEGSGCNQFVFFKEPGAALSR